MSNSFEVIKFTDLEKSPWKNGLGITYQIDISPEGSSLQNLDFDYRLSMAQITGPNDFSIFPGYKRWLTIVEGSGIEMNDHQLKKDELIHFGGEEKITSSPIHLNEKIMDIGIIYNPNKCRVDCEIVNLDGKDLFVNDEDSIMFFIVMNGSIVINDQVILKKDCLKFVPKSKIAFEARSCRVLKVKIKAPRV